jgi:hypothetical protein
MVCRIIELIASPGVFMMGSFLAACVDHAWD